MGPLGATFGRVSGLVFFYFSSDSDSVRWSVNPQLAFSLLRATHDLVGFFFFCIWSQFALNNQFWEFLMQISGTFCGGSQSDLSAVSCRLRHFRQNQAFSGSFRFPSHRRFIYCGYLSFCLFDIHVY